MSVEQLSLGAKAYLYAFPLVFDLEQVSRFLSTGVGAMAPAPLNTFSHARALSTPADDFVSINNDTLYSMAQLDLSAGPVTLTLPDSAGRYYVLQFVDTWTDNFAYVGQRATGTDQVEVVVAGPGQDAGISAAGRIVVHAPTDVVSIVGRWACDGVDDLPAVHALQDQMAVAAPRGGRGIPVVTPSGDDVLDFWEKFRVWSRAFPCAPRDRELEESFAELGITADVAVSDLPAERIARLRDAFAEGERVLEGALRSGTAPVVDGWQLSLHIFDYNLDYFEVGTIDAPEWRIEDPANRVITRAAAAKAGLWGNHAYEAAYLMTYVDDTGAQLSGEAEYTLRLSPPPPVGAFWSLTMYSLPDFYLVANELDRYSIGDRTPGLVYDEDGGVTIRIGRRRPDDPRAAANWLPAPQGAFRPLLRMYIPGEELFDGGYRLPPITRSESPRQTE